MAVNPETAAAIVAWLQDGRSEQQQHAQQYPISNSTVHRIFIRFLETGAYTRRPGTGPQRRTNAQDDRFVVLQSLRNRFATAVEIRNRLHHPVVPIMDREKEKEKLANKMAYNKDIHVTPEKLIKKIENQVECEPLNRFDQIVQEIKEREEWLKEMEELGQGDKYRLIIEQQIQEKVREMQKLKPCD